MPAKKQPVQPEDELTRRLRESARRKRPWSLAVLLAALLVIFGPLGLLVWWTWPEADPPRLVIVACDQLARPGEETTLRAFLEPIGGPGRKIDLSGYDVVFEEKLNLPVAGKEPRRERATSQADGSSAVSWQAPKNSATADVAARYLGDKKRRGAEDRARLYGWPAETPLLLVDVASTLSPEPAESWEEKNILDIPPLPGAGKALQEAAQLKFKVIYLAVPARSPLVYRKYRGWVMNQSMGKNIFPAGPVLGKSSYNQEESAAREAILRGLKDGFTGRMIAVVGTGRAAAVCRAVGVLTILLGPEAAPEDVVRLPSLGDLPAKLRAQK